MTEPSPDTPFFTLNRAQASVVLKALDRTIQGIRHANTEWDVAPDEEKQLDRDAVALMNRMAWHGGEDDKTKDFATDRNSIRIAPIDVTSLPENVHPEWWRQGHREWETWILDAAGDYMGLFRAADVDHAAAIIYLAQVYLAQLDPKTDLRLSVRAAIAAHIEALITDYNHLISLPMVKEMQQIDASSGILYRALRSIRRDISFLTRLSSAYLLSNADEDEIKGVSASNSPVIEPTANSRT